ncbi:MAG: hypothetical protein GY696_16080 [Gammaproteobacteria bacterium]|nr:hypothetical protein [Gammaproteobacteria bacterium]
MKNYIVLDIETGAAEGAALEMEKSLLKPASNIKDPKKIEANLAKKIKGAEEKAALLDSAPITCVGGKTPYGIFVVTSFKYGFDDELFSAGIDSCQEDNELKLLKSLAEFVDSQLYDEETVLVTFNGYHFDIPKLRLAYARNNLEVPDLFCPGRPHVDTMIRYCKYFTVNNVIMCSIGEVVQKLGITESGKLVSGKLFPELVKEGRGLEAVLYNVIDCLMTEQIYFRIGK